MNYIKWEQITSTFNASLGKYKKYDYVIVWNWMTERALLLKNFGGSLKGISSKISLETLLTSQGNWGLKVDF